MEKKLGIFFFLIVCFMFVIRNPNFKIFIAVTRILNELGLVCL
jgi:hypothetical protein